MQKIAFAGERLNPSVLIAHVPFERDHEIEQCRLLIRKEANGFRFDWEHCQDEEEIDALK